MGYSCSAKADCVFKALLKLLHYRGNNAELQNQWTWGYHTYFEERGRENSDGAITGTVYKNITQNSCRKVGSYRIEPSGEITRFPTTTKDVRIQAVDMGLGEYFDKQCRVIRGQNTIFIEDNI